MSIFYLTPSRKLKIYENQQCTIIDRNVDKFVQTIYGCCVYLKNNKIRLYIDETDKKRTFDIPTFIPIKDFICLNGLVICNAMGKYITVETVPNRNCADIIKLIKNATQIIQLNSCIYIDNQILVYPIDEVRYLTNLDNHMVCNEPIILTDNILIQDQIGDRYHVSRNEVITILHNLYIIYKKAIYMTYKKTVNYKYCCNFDGLIEVYKCDVYRVRNGNKSTFFTNTGYITHLENSFEPCDMKPIMVINPYIESERNLIK